VCARVCGWMDRAWEGGHVSEGSLKVGKRDTSLKGLLGSRASKGREPLTGEDQQFSRLRQLQLRTEAAHRADPRPRRRCRRRGGAFGPSSTGEGGEAPHPGLERLAGPLHRLFELGAEQLAAQLIRRATGQADLRADIEKQTRDSDG